MTLVEVSFLTSEFQIFRSFKVKPLFLLGLIIIATISAQLINSANVKLQELIMSKEGITPEIWVYAGIQIVLTFLTEAFVFLMAAFTLSSFPSPNAFWQHLNQFLIESMRSWGKILLGFVFFVIPGLILFLRYILVPFVVVFDSDYAEGNADALERSHRLYSSLSAIQWIVLLVLKLALPTFIAIAFEDINEFKDGALLFLFRQLLEVFALLAFIVIIRNFIKSLSAPQTPAIPTSTKVNI